MADGSVERNHRDIRSDGYSAFVGLRFIAASCGCQVHEAELKLSLPIIGLGLTVKSHTHLTKLNGLV